MDYRQRFLDIHDFLKGYQRIWQNEIMLLYPEPFSDYPADWIEELASFRDKKDVIELEKKKVEGLVKNPKLLSFYRRIEELSAVNQAPVHPPLPEDQFTWLHMIQKKQYEIKHLAPTINHIYRHKKVEKIIDIGGGIGLLAQTLNNYYGHQVTTLDMDPTLQKTGRERHEKNARHPENKVQYVKLKVSAEDSTFQNLLSPKSMTIGLHTCGPLANEQLRASVRKKISGIINFGCCYNRLDTVPGHQNTSRFARSLPDPLIMSQFALTLASRAHKKMDEKDYDLKLKVKLYRYMIHVYLFQEYGLTELTPLGNSHKKLYDESFGVYALDQLKRTDLPIKHTADELNKFYANQDRFEIVWKMITAGLIRNAFGRLLELYILIDRILFLEENDFEANLYEFFLEDLSPRNLGIVAGHRT